MSLLKRVEKGMTTAEDAEIVRRREERLSALEPLLLEVERRGEKEWADDGYDFTVTVDQEMWQQIKDAL